MITLGVWPPKVASSSPQISVPSHVSLATDSVQCVCVWVCLSVCMCMYVHECVCNCVSVCIFVGVGGLGFSQCFVLFCFYPLRHFVLQLYEKCHINKVDLILKIPLICNNLLLIDL